MCNLDHWGEGRLGGEAGRGGWEGRLGGEAGREGTGIQVHVCYSTLSDGSQTGVSVRAACSEEKTEREG